MIDLPHISNFTDFDSLRLEPDVRLRIVRESRDLGNPDAVILPGSKNVIGDLEYLNRDGLADKIMALARAHRWSRMLERGEVVSINELADQQGVDPSLIGRTLRLATLAPDITEAILAGQEPYGLSIRQLTKELPTLWGEQREKHRFIRRSNQVTGE